MLVLVLTPVCHLLQLMLLLIILYLIPNTFLRNFGVKPLGL